MRERWYMAREGERYGPYTWEDVTEFARTGNIGENDLLWSQSTGDWLPAQRIPGLFQPDYAYPSGDKGVVNTEGESSFQGPRAPTSRQPSGKRSNKKKPIAAGIVVLLLTALIVSILPDNGVQPPVDPTPPDGAEPEIEELAGLVDGEEAVQVMAAEFTGDDLKLQFDNGAAFSLPADANYDSAIGEVVISLLSGERFFNTDEDIVFDLSQTEHDYNIDFELDLPSGLEAEDIAVFLYSPGSSKEELDLALVEFDYDQASGKLSSTFTAPTAEIPEAMLAHSPHSLTMLAHSPHSQAVRTASNANSKYTRLAVSYAIRKELADGPVGNTIQMPYYQQAENTCWAAVTKMMARAYAPVNDRRRIIRLHDIVKYMGHSDFDGGMGKWAFTRHVPDYLQSRIGVEFEGSTFLRTKALESEIMRLINEDRPVILNLEYPSVGQHQILVIGYEWKLVGDREDRATFRLLYHDPQGEQVGATTVDKYRWSHFDWLMKDKRSTDAVQIVYADQPPPSARALQTLATPIYNIPVMQRGQAVGDLHFSKSFTHMVYNQAEPRGYRWIKRRTDDVVDVIPADETHINFTQKIYNAAENTTHAILLIEAYIMGGGGKIFEERQNLALPPGRTRHSFEIDLEDFFADEEREVLVLVQLQEDYYLFLDGYDFRFTLAPKEEEDEEEREIIGHATCGGCGNVIEIWSLPFYPGMTPCDECGQIGDWDQELYGKREP